MGTNEYHLPLFETKSSRRRLLFQLYLVSMFVALCFIWVYRASHLPVEQVARWGWIGMFFAEIWFSVYWFLTQVPRWNPIYRYTFRDRLSQRYEKDLPGVDVFVTTADPEIEPPSLVINTVLSTMAYDYPPEKLSVYLSDDGGSELTFYAMLEASRFSRYWLPFCRKFKVEPRSPEAYFRTTSEPRSDDPVEVKTWLFVKKLYNDMKSRIEATTERGQVPHEIQQQDEGFREWSFISSRRDRQTTVQIIIDGRDPKAVDDEGEPLPTLVYLAREKRPQFPHHFKAGAMNALIRVSSRISNGPIILNVDCDMYSNNSGSVRDALCFFMDEEKGHEIAFVQFPQVYENVTKNDIYGSCLVAVGEVEFPGFDAIGGPCYIGSGCFHRRETLCGKKYSKEYKEDWKRVNDRKVEESALVLERECKILASCTYEENTQWGKEMGLKYGCAVEDIITGFSIQCRGWKSVYCNPKRAAFVGLAPTTLLQLLVQQKRWAEGHFSMFLSSHCPFLYGHKRVPLKLQLSYSIYSLWAANCLATLFYVVVPSLCLLRGISLFPQASSPWVYPFVYAFLANRAYGLGEYVWCGGTAQGWWNQQRIWIFQRTTSYLFGFVDNILKLVGLANTGFSVTAKVTDEDVSERYGKEVMEFGVPSPMLNIIATLALLNMLSVFGGLKRALVEVQTKINLDQFALQMILSALLVLINLPVYQGLFFRKDKGRMPYSVIFQSIITALLACSIAMY